MDIPRFYAGRHIFLTGSTGFIGKVLLEKILRCCPDVSGVYVLIRPKKGKTARGRLDALLQAPLFQEVMATHPECKGRVIPIEGDTLHPNFGLRENDIHDIAENVSLVFHCAASVQFQDSLKDALNANVRSVETMLKLIKQMNKFEALIHLSTAYAYCYQKHTDEEIYPASVDANDLLNCPSWMTEDMLEKLAPQLQGDHPNSYTFTKSLAENYLYHNAPKHQTVVVRPSIVTATWKQPMPGWCDSINGPVGIMIAFGKGLLRTMLGDKNSVSNFVPVDIAVNLMIASAWRVATQRSESDIKVYNCTSCETNRFYWGEMSACHRFEWIICHWIPAYLGDAALCCMFRKPRFIKAYKKVQSICDCLNFFTMGRWTWNINNMKLLQNAMSKEDREMFYFDTSTIDWKKHMTDYHVGVKKYILKEKMENLSETKKWLKYRQCLSSFVTGLILLVLCRRNWVVLKWLLLNVVRRMFRIFAYLSQCFH